MIKLFMKSVVPLSCPRNCDLRLLLSRFTSSAPPFSPVLNLRNFCENFHEIGSQNITKLNQVKMFMPSLREMGRTNNGKEQQTLFLSA
jgi:hypothetical protein